MIHSQQDLGTALGKAIAQRIGQQRYDLWFAHKTKFMLDGECLTVGVPNRFYLDWLQTRFAKTVADTAAEIVQAPIQARFVIDPELFQAARQAQLEGTATDVGAVQRGPASEGIATAGYATAAAAAGSAGMARPGRRWRRLEDFIVGSCNRVAFAAAQSLAEAPAEAASPLVLYGSVGTGKTHLLEGICAGLQRSREAGRVVFATAEEFTNRFLAAMRLGKMTTFRKQFRECDVLLVDDLDFLARKRATQEEFLHTLDTLVRNGRRVAASCDCHPKLSGDFLPELTDRLIGGALWSLQPPDRDTRRAILQAKSALAEPRLPDDVLDYLAEQVPGNARELEGVVHALRHVAHVQSAQITLQLAVQLVAEHLRQVIRTVKIEEIDRAVCQVLHLSTGVLQSRQRTWAVSHPRMLAIYLARKHTRLAYSEISKYFKCGNHSSAVAAEKRIRGWLQDDEDLVVGDRRMKVRDAIGLVERTWAG